MHQRSTDAGGTLAPTLPATLTGFRDRHRGQTIVVCGCGRSLNDLDAPERFITIGVNDVGRRFDPTYLVVVDPPSSFKGDRFRYVAESRAQAVFTPCDLGIAHPNIVRFALGRRGGLDFDHDHALDYTSNSPYVAVLIAIRMGAARIALTGVDFGSDHFFARTGRHVLERRLAEINEEYGRLVSAAARRGIEIVNIGESSRLTSVPRASIASLSEPLTARNPAAPLALPAPGPRVFFVNYRFQAAGDVFATGLTRAANAMRLTHAAAWCDDAALPRKIAAFAPDLVLVVQGRLAVTRWPKLFSRYNSAVWLLDEPYEVDDSSRWSTVFKTVFVNDASTERRHRGATYLPTCYDPETHYDSAESRSHDVGFIGAGSRTRERVLAAIATRGQLSYVVGGPWRQPVLRQLTRAPLVSPSGTADLYRHTRIIVNVFRDRHQFNRTAVPPVSMNPRIYEALACGALVVSEPRPEISNMLPELPTFREAGELSDTIAGLLAKPDDLAARLSACRARIAGADYTARLARVIEVACPASSHPKVSVVSAAPTERRAPFPADWIVMGTGTVSVNETSMTLSADTGPVTLVSESDANDVELAFSLKLDGQAVFIAKLHLQVRDDDTANSYHFVSRPTGSYVARHHLQFGAVPLVRDVWQRIRLRWADQRLRLFVEDAECVYVCDNLMQSGYSAIGLTAGRADIRDLVLRNLSTRAHAAAIQRAAPASRTRLEPTPPFTTTPVRNLLYHVWPVRGEMWRWNVDQILARIDLFNGRRVVGIVHDDRSEEPDEVRARFDGQGCEFVVIPNDPSGEGLTFPTMLARIRSLDLNEVSFYAHAKGVKYEPDVPEPVRRWANTQYRVSLDDWPSVRNQLMRFAMTGSFKMLGPFRVHRYLGDWHYSGTFFWFRHATAFQRDVERLHSFYGCVEAWPGIHFRREETGCLFADNLRQLPYRPEFWRDVGNPELAKWEAAHRPLPPPVSLRKPQRVGDGLGPRLEQQPEEFAWWLDQLVAASPRTLLTIGCMHGGLEWQVARRFRTLGRDIAITAVDIVARPELQAALADARSRFGQQIELVVGDSSAQETRDRLAPQYDAVFIDGDHTYRGARADFDFARTRSPRLIALHDIVDSDWHAASRCCVSRVWREVRSTHQTEERTTADWGGIGIVRLET